MKATPAHDVLNELIRIATEGELFYREAALRVAEPSLADAFAGLAQCRARLIEDFSGWATRNAAQPAYDGTLLGAMRRLYAEGRAVLVANPEDLFVDPLEEMEDLLLEYYETALETTTDPEVRVVLQRHLPAVRAAHRELQQFTLQPQGAAASPGSKPAHYLNGAT